MTFSTLKTDLNTLFVRTDLDTSSYTTLAVKLCEQAIRRDVRVRDMETSATLTITDGTASLPTGYLETRRLILDKTSGQSLDYLTPEQMYSAEIYGDSGTATAFTIEGDSFIFRPKNSDSALLVYYKAYDALSGDSDTNWLMQNAYDVYLFGTAYNLASMIRNMDRAKEYQVMYQMAVDNLNKSESRSRFPAELKATGVWTP